MTLTMHIGEFKARFSAVVEVIKNGVTNKGKSGDFVGCFGKNLKLEKPGKRTYGFFNMQRATSNPQDSR